MPAKSEHDRISRHTHQAIKINVNTSLVMLMDEGGKLQKLLLNAFG
jgi:hypothetical protein